MYGIMLWLTQLFARPIELDDNFELVFYTFGGAM